MLGGVGVAARVVLVSVAFKMAALINLTHVGCFAWTATVKAESPSCTQNIRLARKMATKNRITESSAMTSAPAANKIEMT